MHNKVLSGTHILQVIELVNIGIALHNAEKKEETNDSESRVLKLLLSDGKQEVIALEYNFVPSFSQLIPGMKIQIQDVFVRRGMLLLSNDVVKILGGSNHEMLLK